MPVGFWPFKTIGSIENTVIVVVHLIYVTRVFFDRKKNTYLVYAWIQMDNQLHLEKVYLSFDHWILTDFWRVPDIWLRKKNLNLSISEYLIEIVHPSPRILEPESSA